MRYIPAVGLLATVAAAAKDSTTFAVLRFNGDGFMTEGRMDPIVDPGEAASHYHGVMGGDNFNLTVEGNDLLSSSCTSAKIANDFSNYWVPSLFFQPPGTSNKFQKVPLFYMNVYYFFEASNDDIKAFPPGLKIVTGDTFKRTPPSTSAVQLDPSAGEINNIQFTCPQADGKTAPVYPANSDGSTAGIADPVVTDAGVGFPTAKCDGYASPLRQDIHFPSCYNPKAGLDDYKNNMVFPSDAGDGKKDCPEGYTHTPHMFFEIYWNTPEFSDQWEVDGATQPFVYSNGDATGFGAHADFISGWDTNTLQTIIDTCDAGTVGMDTCPDIPGGLNTDNDCTLAPMITEPISILSNTVQGALSALPGDNPVTGWGKGGVTDSDIPKPDDSGSSSSSSSAAPVTVPTSTSSSAAAEVASATETTAKPAATEEPTTTQAAAATTAAPSPSGGAFVEQSGVETVWDVVTVTDTTTMYVEPTEVPSRRSAGHAHQHVGRHQHRGQH